MMWIIRIFVISFFSISALSLMFFQAVEIFDAVIDMYNDFRKS